jgi:diadenosine tetraphosphate (Ap4A) HIT family hydrolase
VQNDPRREVQAGQVYIGFNVDVVGGQTVLHCHCHVIPRYVGDVPNPRGGVRGVVPEKRGY